MNVVTHLFVDLFLYIVYIPLRFLSCSSAVCVEIMLPIDRRNEWTERIVQISHIHHEFMWVVSVHLLPLCRSKVKTLGLSSPNISCVLL